MNTVPKVMIKFLINKMTRRRFNDLTQLGGEFRMFYYTLGLIKFNSLFLNVKYDSDDFMIFV